MSKEQNVQITVVGTEDHCECFEFGIESLDQVIQVEIKYLSDDDMQKIDKKSKKKVWRNGRKQLERDERLFQHLFTKEALVSITGMTWEGFKKIIEKNVKLQLEGADWKDEVKFNDQVKSIIVNYPHWKFFSFLLAKARDVQDELEEEVAEELGNL